MRYVIIPLILVVACSKTKQSTKPGGDSKPVPEGFANSLNPADVPAARQQSLQLSKELTESVFGQVIQADKLPAVLDLSANLDMVDANIVNESVCGGHVRKVLGLTLSSFASIEGIKKDDGKITNLFDDAKRDPKATKLDQPPTGYAIGFKIDQSNDTYQDKYKKTGFLNLAFAGSTTQFVFRSIENTELTPTIVDVASTKIVDVVQQLTDYNYRQKTIQIAKIAEKSFMGPGGISTGQGSSEDVTENLSAGKLEYTSTAISVTKSKTVTSTLLEASPNQLLVTVSEIGEKDGQETSTVKKTRIVRSDKGECSVEQLP